MTHFIDHFVLLEGYFDALCSEAKNCGYEIGAKVVQDNKVGGYTTRKRAVIIGSCIGPVSFPDFELVSGGHTAGEALSKVNDGWTNYPKCIIRTLQLLEIYDG